MIKRISGSLLVAVALVAGSGADALSQTSTGLAFLKVGTDAANMSRGRTGSSYESGAFATYWNPAGLATTGHNEAGIGNHIWLGNIQLYSLAARFAHGTSGGFGVSLQAATLGGIPIRSGPGPEEGFFSTEFVTTGVSYGRAIGPVSLGATVKYVSERIFDQSANGVAADVGIRYSLREDGLSAGIVLQHLGTVSELASIASTLPTTIRGGVSLFPFRILASLDDATLLTVQVLAEASYLIEESRSQVHLGTQAALFEVLLLRAGYMTGEDAQRLSAGLGLLLDSFEFDYAFIPFQGGFDSTGHVFSFVYQW